VSDYQQRFAATARLYGEQSLDYFQQIHIVIVGVGGVGSWAAESLARTGIGRLSLVDHDTISQSNINRQIHSLDNTLDRSKVDVMKERIALINPYCQIRSINDKLSADNCADILLPGSIDINAMDKSSSTHLKKVDYVIDAIDSVKQKAELLAFCKSNKIKIITTGGAGGLTDPTQITIADLSKTYNDPLASKVRYLLRSKFNFSRNPKSKFGIDCVFSTEQAVYPQQDGSVSHTKPTVQGLRLDCNYGYGSSVNVTCSFAMAAVARVLKKLTVP
jgi:tRNA A37 threonylcarbamoyladenosine dehydratase